MERVYLESVDSTNKWAKENIDNINDQTVVYTFNQTAGRGRLNRSWSNIGTDNIYASFVLKPSDTMKNVYSNLTQYLCVILAQTFEEYGVKTEIKWPNDIKVNGKKISGILAESVIEKGKLEGIILGVGINLNSDRKILESITQPATALNLETGKTIDKFSFLEKLSDRFCLLYDEFIGEGFLFIKEDYIKRAYFLNKEVTVKVFDKSITGIASDITNEGSLIIKDSASKEHTLLIGDIL